MRSRKTERDQLVGQAPGRLAVGIYLYDPADDFDAFKVVDHSRRPGGGRYGWWRLLNEVTMRGGWYRAEDLASMAYLPKHKWPQGGAEAHAV